MKFKTKYFPWLMGILLALFLGIPLLNSNAMTSWDHVGHIFNIKFMQENLLPNFEGWIPFTSLGYSFSTYYPSTLHYLVAVLSSIAGSPALWLKLLFLLVVLVLPHSIYFFQKTLFRAILNDQILARRKKTLTRFSGLISLFVTIIIVFGPELYGGSVQSYLKLGLLGNFFMMPVLFYFLGNVVKLYKKPDFKRILVSSLLLSTLMWSHLVAGLVGLLVLVTVSLGRFVSNVQKKHNAKTILLEPLHWVGALTVLMVLSFYFGILNYSSYVLSPKGIPSEAFLTILMCGALGMSVLANIKNKAIKDNHLFWSIGLLFNLLAGLSFLELVANKLNIGLEFGLFQPYRTLGILVYIAPLYILTSAVALLFSLENRFIILKQLRRPLLLKIGAGALILAGITGVNVLDLGQKDYGYFQIANEAKEIKGNTYYILDVNNNYNLYRNPYYAILDINKEVRFFGAQYAESSFFADLNSYIKDSLLGVAKADEKLSLDKIKQIFTLSAIEYVVFDSGLKYEVELCEPNTTQLYGKYISNTPGADLKFCKLSNEFKTTDLKLTESTQKAWRDDYTKWLKQNTNEIFIDNNFANGKTVSALPASQIKYANGYQSFTVDTSASTTDWTIIPIQAFPRWQPTAIVKKGETTNLNSYRVSPNLLAVNYKGEIEFNYEYSQLDMALKLISTGTLVVVLVVLGGVIVRKKSI